MGQSALASVIFRSLSLVCVATMPLSFARAHEGAEMDCSRRNIDAMTADIQAMPDGEAKTTAMTELKMAEDKMADKDMEGCKSHLYNAMEATEE